LRQRGTITQRENEVDRPPVNAGGGSAHPGRPGQAKAGAIAISSSRRLLRDFRLRRGQCCRHAFSHVAVSTVIEAFVSNPDL